MAGQSFLCITRHLLRPTIIYQTSLHTVLTSDSFVYVCTAEFHALGALSSPRVVYVRQLMILSQMVDPLVGGVEPSSLLELLAVVALGALEPLVWL